MLILLALTLLPLVVLLLVLTYRERHDPLQWVLVGTMFPTGQLLRTGSENSTAILTAAVLNCTVAGAVLWWWMKERRRQV
jgi:hypothetical protein